MLITIQIKEELSWHHLPDNFVLVVDDGIALSEVIDLIGVKTNEIAEIKINGKKVDLGVSVSEGDVIQFS